MGDAAHATTPNLGQGAGQAIEDAMAISQSLAKHNDIKQAYNHFESIRRKKVSHVVNTSWKVGKMAHIKNPIAIALRNIMMKSIPKKMALKQNEKIYTINY